MIKINNSLKINIIRYLIIVLGSVLIITSCNSSKLIPENEEKCPYLEGKDD